MFRRGGGSLLTAVDASGIYKLCPQMTDREAWFWDAEGGETGIEEFRPVE